MPTYVTGDPEATGGGKHVEPGEYQATIISAKETLSKAGNDMIVLDVQIKDGPVVSEFLVFTESASWKVDQVRAAVGEVVRVGEKVMITPQQFVGKSAQVMVTDKPGTGDKVYNEIERWVVPPQQKDIPF